MSVLYHCAESACTSKTLSKCQYMSQPSLSLAQAHDTKTCYRIDCKTNQIGGFAERQDPRPINAEPMTNPSLRVHCLVTRHIQIVPPQEFVIRLVLGTSRSHFLPRYKVSSPTSQIQRFAESKLLLKPSKPNHCT